MRLIKMYEVHSSISFPMSNQRTVKNPALALFVSLDCLFGAVLLARVCVFCASKRMQVIWNSNWDTERCNIPEPISSRIGSIGKQIGLHFLVPILEKARPRPPKQARGNSTKIVTTLSNSIAILLLTWRNLSQWIPVVAKVLHSAWRLTRKPRCRDRGPTSRTKNERDALASKQDTHKPYTSELWKLPMK